MRLRPQLADTNINFAAGGREGGNIGGSCERVTPLRNVNCISLRNGTDIRHVYTARHVSRLDDANPTHGDERTSAEIATLYYFSLMRVFLTRTFLCCSAWIWHEGGRRQNGVGRTHLRVHRVDCAGWPRREGGVAARRQGTFIVYYTQRNIFWI